MFDRKSDIERFLTLAECGNAVVAARELGITHQAVSYTLSVLTRRAGAALLEKTAHGLRPTALGTEAVVLARRLLRGFEDGAERLTSLREGQTGRLHVAAGAGFLQTLLPAAIAAFQEDHPAVEVAVGPAVEVAMGPAGDDVFDLLAAGGCDLYCGSLTTSDVPAELRRTPLPALTLGLVAARGHPLEGREPTWEDLADHPWIDFDGNLRRIGLLDTVRKHTGRPVRRVVRAGGDGLLLMQSGFYLTHLASNFLERLPGQFLVPLPGLIGAGFARSGIVTRRSDDDLPATRRLRQAVAEAAGED